MTDIGACIASPGPSAFIGVTQVAGAETEIVSGVHDHKSGGDLLGHYHSAVGFITGDLTVAVTTTTLSFTGIYEHSDTSGSGFVTLGTATASTIVKTDSGPFTFQLENLDLSQAKQFVRFKASAVISSGGTDTAVSNGHLIVAGPQNKPTDRT